MSFTSLSFLFFAPAVIFIYYLIPRRFYWAWLCLASITFYGYWNIYYVPLILVSALLDYCCSILMSGQHNRQYRKRWLYFSLFGNLGILFFFKYANFIGGGIGSLFDGPIEIHQLILPVGLSFYTLQTLSYTFDVYREKITAERHFGHYFLYVSFFPQLVAGPIERASRLLPQLKQLRLPSIAGVRLGVILIVWGVFLKLTVADNLTTFIHHALYDSQWQGLALWSVCALIMLKVYCDFLAYSEIARGCARLLGISLSHNFRQPFLAKNLNSFWQRWHITLTRWLVDYVQVPLMRRYHQEPLRSLVGLLTICLIGFWHGASWNFILFGLTHGCAMIFWRAVSSNRSVVALLGRSLPYLSRVFLYVVLVVSAPMFYVNDTYAMVDILLRLFYFELGFDRLMLTQGKMGLLLALPGLIVVLFHDLISERNQAHQLEKIVRKSSIRRVLYISLVVMIILLANMRGEPFVYFAF